jgi:hypothetical protein
LDLSLLDWDAGVPEGWTPMSAVTIFKSLDEDGDVRVSLRATSDLRAWDLMGMLRGMLLDVERQWLNSLEET